MLDDADDLAARHEFLVRYAADLEAGAAQGLEHYQALFPGHEAAVAEEFAALTDAGADVDRDVTAADPADGTTASATRIAHYRLLREIGRGGQATVYLARDTRLGRDVALKLLPRDLASVEQELRLRREAQTAGRWHDPCICEVFDVGQDGSHLYVTMRHVPGETLAARIHRTRERHGRGRAVALRPDGDPSPLGEVLEVFEKLARSLHRAHVDGVVHRDVKPNNVMITPQGEPVLLDFGLAMDSESTLPTLTRSGERFGTPAYMAPEQIEGSARDADARCDVYALGVSLYEATTLERPFAAPTLDGLYREILTHEPADVRRLNRTLPRDLAIVLQTALAKAPGSRYQTALDLAEELARIRRGESIRARPTSFAVRAWRWRRRHPAWAASLALGALGVVGLLVQQANAVAEITLARDEAEALNDFLIEEMLLGVTPDQARGRDLTVAEVFDRAATRIDGAFAAGSLVGASVRHLLGAANASISRYAEARGFLEQAARTRADSLGDDDHRTLDTRLRLAWTLLALDELDEARSICMDVLERRRRIDGEEAEPTIAAWQALMEIDFARAHYESVRDCAREVLDRAQKALGENHPRTLSLGEQLARALARLDRRDEAEALLRDGLARRTDHGDPTDPDLQDAMMSLASLLHDRALDTRTTDDWDAAEELYRRALAHAQSVYGARHRSYGIALNNLGLLLKDRGLAEADDAVLAAATDHLESSLALRRELFGDDHSMVATALESLGGVLYARNDYGRAEPLMQEGYDRSCALFGADHPRSINGLMNLGACILRRGDAARALPHFDTLIAAADARFDDAFHGRAHYFRGTCLRDLGRPREALAAAERAWDLFVGTYGENHRSPRIAAALLADVHAALGDADAAAAWRARSSG